VVHAYTRNGALKVAKILELPIVRLCRNPHLLCRGDVCPPPSSPFGWRLCPRTPGMKIGARRQKR
jgi:hypothetical protein